MERKKNKQPKLHLKTGDNVLVIAGDAKDGIGKVLSIDMEKQRAIVEGLKHYSIVCLDVCVGMSVLRLTAATFCSDRLVLRSKTKHAC